MSAISVQNLSKFYEVHQKEPGFVGSLKSFVRRKTYDVKAVDDISFSIESGRVSGLPGAQRRGQDHDSQSTLRSALSHRR